MADLPDRIVTICLDCGEIINQARIHCPYCLENRVRQQNIGWLFPENLERFGIELPDVRPEEVECLEESPEMTRKKETGG